MSYNLFLDDIRDVKDGYCQGEKMKLEDLSQIPRGNWKVVRDYDQFVYSIKNHGIPMRVSFDNDLCEKHMLQYIDSYKTGIFEWEGACPKMGIHCLNYLLDACRTSNTPLPIIFIHTANSKAREIMNTIIKEYKDFYPQTQKDEKSP